MSAADTPLARRLFRAFQDALDRWYAEEEFQAGARPSEVSAALGWLTFLLCEIGEADATLIAAASQEEREQVTDLVRGRLLGEAPRAKPRGST